MATTFADAYTGEVKRADFSLADAVRGEVEIVFGEERAHLGVEPKLALKVAQIIVKARLGAIVDDCGNEIAEQWKQQSLGGL